jgi:hypothetical protein
MPTHRSSYHYGNLRAALTDAALDLARHGGPAAVTVRGVARSVGVTPPAAYRHFAELEELLTATKNRALTLLAEGVDAALGSFAAAEAGEGWAESSTAAAAGRARPIASVAAGATSIAEAGTSSIDAATGCEWPISGANGSSVGSVAAGASPTAGAPESSGGGAVRSEKQIARASASLTGGAAARKGSVGSVVAGAGPSVGARESSGGGAVERERSIGAAGASSVGSLAAGASPTVGARESSVGGAVRRERSIAAAGGSSVGSLAAGASPTVAARESPRGEAAGREQAAMDPGASSGGGPVGRERPIVGVGGSLGAASSESLIESVSAREYSIASAAACLRAVAEAYVSFAQSYPGLFAMACHGSADTIRLLITDRVGPFLDALSARRPGMVFALWSAVHALAVLASEGASRDVSQDEVLDTVLAWIAGDVLSSGM